MLVMLAKVFSLSISDFSNQFNRKSVRLSKFGLGLIRLSKVRLAKVFGC
jgi:hypothetical protein